MHLSKESRIQMAVSAYQKEQVKSIQRAAALFTIPKSTLCDRLHGVKSRSETRVNSHKLTEFEE